jgi:hypothetical protein
MGRYIKNPPYFITDFKKDGIKCHSKFYENRSGGSKIYYSSDQIEKSEIAKACGMCGGKERRGTCGVLVGNVSERENLED